MSRTTESGVQTSADTTVQLLNSCTAAATAYAKSNLCRHSYPLMAWFKPVPCSVHSGRTLNATPACPPLHITSQRVQQYCALVRYSNTAIASHVQRHCDASTPLRLFYQHHNRFWPLSRAISTLRTSTSEHVPHAAEQPAYSSNPTTTTCCCLFLQATNKQPTGCWCSMSVIPLPADAYLCHTSCYQMATSISTTNNRGVCALSKPRAA
jgi:hypothetical protein